MTKTEKWARVRTTSVPRGLSLKDTGHLIRAVRRLQRMVDRYGVDTATEMLKKAADREDLDATIRRSDG